MGDLPPSELPVPTCSRPEGEQESHGLASDAYTIQKLKNASPEHLHVTNRRFFVGPLPRGWVHSRRRSWYKGVFGLRDYSSRAPSFSAADVDSLVPPRQTSGFSGSGGAGYQQPFPQPDDVDVDRQEEGEGGEENGDGPRDAEASREGPDDPSADQPQPQEGGQQSSEQRDTTDGQRDAEASREGPDDPSADQPQPQEGGQQSSEQRDATDGQRSQPQPVGTKKKVAFPDGAGLPRSTSTYPDDVYFTPPEFKLQRDGFTWPSSSPTVAEGSGARRPSTRNANKPTPSSLAVTTSRDTESGETPVPSARSSTAAPTDLGSEASLLQHQTHRSSEPETENEPTSQRTKATDLQHQEPRADDDQLDHHGSGRADQGDQARLDRRVRGRVNTARSTMEDVLAERRQRLQYRRSNQPGDTSEPDNQISACREGEIIRAERMLVRIETTKQSVPVDFSENAILKIDTRTVKSWREYLVVCRRGFDETTPALLQMYKTRVVPRVDSPQVKKRCSHEILLRRGTTNANLFSGLDKSLVVWHPYKGATRLILMQARSAAHSVEWYTFIRDCMGRKEPSTLLVHVPDLDVSLRLTNPFAHFSLGRSGFPLTGADPSGQQQAIASFIIDSCMDTLKGASEWSPVIDLWTESERMGLAWRRYDRLEWVQGANEQRMYGMHTMRKSHELELRPKQHYPTFTDSAGAQRVEEPTPVEGFMILLTSQRGGHSRLGTTYYRRLYFHTQDQYLCFTRPAKATPPAPPRVSTIRGPNARRASDTNRKPPVMYDVDPFPLKDGKISWLVRGPKAQRAHIRRHDSEAYAESRRNVSNLARAEGYVNLCRVVEIRAAAPENDAGAETYANGGDTEFHGERRNSQGSSTQGAKGNRTLELVLDEGIVVQLRSYDKETRDQWIVHLNALMTYWKARTRDDIIRLMSVRRHNLENLDINEAQESVVGQFAQKWEVSRAEASPELFHTCGMSGCRNIKISGHLFRKTRRRAPFTRCSVILMEGQLLIFQGSVRNWSGAQLQHSHHERQTVLDLRDCYIYSGIITSSDLLYQSQTFDSNLPGHRSTPRIYLADGWTSTDEDTATCFVIWRGSRKSLFRGEEETQGKVQKKWRQVSALGVAGKSIVFKTRSRAERDLWVLAIETEIDRLQNEEDIRVVSN